MSDPEHYVVMPDVSGYTADGLQVIASDELPSPNSADSVEQAEQESNA